MTLKALCLLIGALGVATNTFADTSDDFWRVTKYATVLGSAQACGQDIENSFFRVEQWMGTTFSGEDLAVQTQLFNNTIKYSAEKQKKMKSPCSLVVKTYNETKWP